jgi:hypothetical protein
VELGGPGLLQPPVCGVQGLGGPVHARQLDAGVARREFDRLRTDPTAQFEHAATGREAGVVVQQVSQCRGLVLQPVPFSGVVAVHVVLVQDHGPDHLHQHGHCRVVIGVLRWREGARESVAQREAPLQLHLELAQVSA